VILPGAADSTDLGGSSNTQVRPLRANVEKGSMLTAIEHGSVGPKRMAKAISESKAV